MSEFFKVHHKLIGKAQQKRISKAHIAVVGVGGLGCSVCMGLVRLGVKNLTLIDADKIEISNIPRQILYNATDVGLPKVQTAKCALTAIFDDLNITCFEESITSKNGIEFLKNVEIVIDCTDNYIARYAISKCSQTLKIPMIYGGVEGFSGQVGVFNFNGSSPFHVIFPNIQNLLVEENCNASGVLPFVVQTIGNLQVVETFKILCNADTILHNQIYCVNTLTGKQRTIKLLTKE